MVSRVRPRHVRSALAALAVLAISVGVPAAQATEPKKGDVTKVWTDYEGFWDSTDPREPDTAHHLLAFEVDGTVFSTGVDDSKLSTNEITFTPGDWRALPVEGMPAVAPVGHANYIVIRGGSARDSGIIGTLTSDDISSFLTRGTQGLDLGSGVANIPGGTVLSFNLPTIDASALADGVPVILVTQIANPAYPMDTLRFVDGDGNQVGASVNIDQNDIPRVAGRNTWRARYWTAPGNTLATVSPDNSLSKLGVSSGLRLKAFELSDFGLDGDNVGDVRRLLWTAGGSSDPAFFAYNASSIDVVADSVAVGSASITMTSISDRRVADGPTTVSATSSASLVITFVSSDASVCVVDAAGVVTPVALGTCTITASTAAETVASTFYPAATATTSFAVVAPVPPPPASSEPVAPSFVTRDGSAPELPAARGELQREDGSVVTLTVASPASGSLRYRTDGLVLTLSSESTSDPEEGLLTGRSGLIECEVCTSMQPGSVIEVWMFSTPRLVAAWEVMDAPCQRFLIPVGAPLDGGPAVGSGTHTLQLVLPTASGRQAVNVGMTVSGPVPNAVPAGSGTVPLPGALTPMLVLALVLGGLLIAHRSGRGDPRGAWRAPGVEV